MAKGYILYNPLAGNGKTTSDIKTLELVLPDPVEYFDMTRITNYAAFLAGLEPEDYLVIAGGDGTLNRFVNAAAQLNIPNEVFFFPVGTGNDFARDLGKEALSVPFPISKFLQNLPIVEVNGKQYRFVNGIGYGIDGYCCQVGDELKKIPGKKVNYTSIAIKGLLFHYKTTGATITVDGQVHHFEKVWLAPTMHGRYYGGGMMPAPDQLRNNSDGTLSVMVFHCGSKLKTLCVFPSLFKGEHIKHKSLVTILTGRQITVEFDRPTPLQIDGETVLGVSSYTAHGSKKAVRA